MFYETRSDPTSLAVIFRNEISKGFAGVFVRPIACDTQDVKRDSVISTCGGESVAIHIYEAGAG